MNNKRHQFKMSVVTIACCFCVLTLTVSGCAPLRKKFTRKKKENGEQNQKFTPVLEPIDYPARVYAPLERYKQHYSLWKVWDRDLLQTIDRDGSDKRQKYLLEQAIAQLEAMETILIDDKRKEFAVLVDGLRAVRSDYERSSAMRSKFSIRMKIKRNASKIRNEFAPDPSLFAPEL